MQLKKIDEFIDVSPDVKAIIREYAEHLIEAIDADVQSRIHDMDGYPMHFIYKNTITSYKDYI